MVAQPSLDSLSAGPAYSTPVSSAPTPVFSVSSSAQLPPISQPAEQSQLRRAYDRLQTRHARLEAENQELRENNFANRTDLSRVDADLDKILAEHDLPAEVEDKLSKISEILLVVNGRLR